MLVFSQENKFVIKEGETLTIPEINIEKYKNNPDFNYQPLDNKKNFIVQAVDWLKRKLEEILYKFFTWILDQKSAKGIVRLILTSLPYIAIAVFVYLLFKFLIGLDLIFLKRKNNYPTNQVFLSDDEHIINEEDIEKLIQQALIKKDYRLAIRYQYLNILKQLKNKELIQWHPDKTNREYVQELKNPMLKPQFKRLTLLYDYIWYGNYNLAKEDFQKINHDFKSFPV